LNYGEVEFGSLDLDIGVVEAIDVPGVALEASRGVVSTVSDVQRTVRLLDARGQAVEMDRADSAAHGKTVRIVRSVEVEVLLRPILFHPR
jgi:hypothetical protein